MVCLLDHTLDTGLAWLEGKAVQGELAAGHYPLLDTAGDVEARVSVSGDQGGEQPVGHPGEVSSESLGRERISS